MSNGEKDIQSMNPEECQTEIDTTLENAEHVYWGKPGSGPSHTRAVERMRLLHEKALGTKGEEPHNGLTEKLREEGVETEEDIKKIAEDAKKVDEDEDEGEEIPLTPEQEEGFKKLKGEWGNEFDARIDEARAIYQGVLQTYAKDNPGFAELMETSLGNEPSVVKLFAEIGRVEREAQPFTCPHCGEKITDEED